MMRTSSVLRISMGIGLVLLTAGMARAQDPADQTPSAPPAGQARGPRGARPEVLPQMPGNGGDVNRDALIAAARAGLDALKSGDVAAYEAMITDDAVMVDENGLERKPDVVKRLADFQLKDYTMSDVRLVPVSPDNGVVSYTLTESGTRQGHAFSAKVFVSSAWVKTGRQFQCVFRQETTAPAK